MPRGSRTAKIREWTERLARFHRSGLSVARFCQQDGVSQVSFYQWKKKLFAANKAEVGAASALGAARFRAGKSGESPLFQPLQLTPAAQAVTIRLPDGIEIQIADNLRLIESVIGQLLEAQTKLAAQTGERRRGAC